MSFLHGHPGDNQENPPQNDEQRMERTETNTNNQATGNEVDRGKQEEKPCYEILCGISHGCSDVAIGKIIDSFVSIIHNLKENFCKGLSDNLQRLGDNITKANTSLENMKTTINETTKILHKIDYILETLYKEYKEKPKPLFPPIKCDEVLREIKKQKRVTTLLTILLLLSLIANTILVLRQTGLIDPPLFLP